jgi:ribonuclease D
LQQHSVLAFDTEFVGEYSYRPELCLIQVATTKCLYLIDPYAVGSLDDFWALLLSPDRLTVAHAGREDIRLCWFLSGSPPARLFDTQIAAGLVGLSYPMSYASLVQQTLNVRLIKSDTLSDWRKRPLSTSQIRYAFDDVRYLLPVHQRLQNRLKTMSRTAWAEEEFEAFTSWAIGEQEAQEPWRKVKGIGALSRRELAVLREAYAWRDVIANRQNRPARSVLRDDVMIELARRGAKEPDTLQHVRGLPSRELPILMRAIQEANALPQEKCPARHDAEQDPPQVASLGTLLNVALADLCERLKLSQPLICSQNDLKDLVRSRCLGRPLPADSPFKTSPWRVEHILPHLENILTGRFAVRVGDAKNHAPLEYIELPRAES